MKGRLTQFSHILGSVTFKSSMMLAFTAVVVASLAFGVEKLTAGNDTSACACSSDTRYNNSLPSSHPNNRCAEHGHQDKPIDDMKPANSQQSY